MKSVSVLLALGASTMLLAGCGSDDGKNYGVDRSTLPEAVISEFSVIGTSPAQGDIIPLNANVEDGKFSIKWNVTSADSFHLRIFLSQDDQASADDIRIFNNGLCGAVRVNDCFGADQYECQFSPDNTLTCTDGWENYSDDLAANGFLTALPQQAYFIGEACVGSDCKRSAVKVEFQ